MNQAADSGCDYDTIDGYQWMVKSSHKGIYDPVSMNANFVSNRAKRTGTKDWVFPSIFL